MSEAKNSLSLVGRFGLLLLLLAGIAIGAVALIKAFGAVLLAILGIGLIVLFHELGHFTAAKLMDIHVEGFSIGFPPVLATIKRTTEGYLVKILPGAPKEEGGQLTSLLSFKLGGKCKPGETEYRIGLIPFGGYVKMLGQEDIGEVKATDDPRSYANKPVSVRMAVIIAGVLFNVLCAAVIFIGVFLKGVSLIPPVVGDVWANSPAQRAGLEPGDEFIVINGREFNLQFMHIFEAAGLSAKGKSIPVTVKKRDGSVVDLELVAKQLPGETLKVFGVGYPSSLTIASLSEDSAAELVERTHLRSGDCVVSVNGRDVKDYFDLMDELGQLYQPTVTLLASRQSKGDEKSRLIESEIGIEYLPSAIDANSESGLSHIYSMVPALKVTMILPDVEYAGEREFELGDVITNIGDVAYPTYIEMREVTNEHSDKKLDIKVLRIDESGLEQKNIVQVIPRTVSNRTVIGIVVGLDLNRPVVAKTIESEEIAKKLAIERGARIVSVGGKKVESFFDVIEQLRNTSGPNISIKWQNQQSDTGQAELPVGEFDKLVTIKGVMEEAIPFELLERIYKAEGPLIAIGMGFYEMAGYVKHAALTLRQFFGGQVSPKNFLGPVGIVKISYDIVKSKPLTYYIYFLGLINAFIAVFNLIPILPFDGGHVVLLGIEKIKGKPVNERIQAGMVYVGVVLVVVFALYLTFNDIVRLFKPLF